MKIMSIAELRNSNNVNFANGPVSMKGLDEMWAYYEIIRIASPDDITDVCLRNQEAIRMEAKVSGLSYVYDVVLPAQKLVKNFIKNLGVTEISHAA